MTLVYRIADLNIEITVRGAYALKLLAPYEIKDYENIDFSVTVSDEELDEAVKSAPEFPKAYHESLCVLRQISNKLLNDYGGFLFHSSTVAYGGKAYAFTAQSGTGKSTHTALLKKLLGEKLGYVNDDKPFVRYFENGAGGEKGTFYVYGNPWNGKHNLGENVKFPLESVCFLSRGAKNEIKKVSDPVLYMPFILNQVVYPENGEQAEKLLSLLQIMFDKIKFYDLKCNMESDAPKTSFNAMMKGND